MNIQTKYNVLKGIVIGISLLIGAVFVALLIRFTEDTPVNYVAIEDHFKYGSTGGERTAGFPYPIWKVLPRVCQRHLPEETRGNLSPGREYEAFGFIYEKGKALPIGMSKRRHLGIDRVFLNCAVCHTGTIRDTPNSALKIVTGMPAHRLRLMAFERFIFSCAKDKNFSPNHLIPEIEQSEGRLSLLDRSVVYPLAIYLMRDQLLRLESSFAFMLKPGAPDWGPGRVDTFGSAKAVFQFAMDKAPERELIGTTDFPSIWLQAPRKGMHLHWDGNNNKVEERNKSAAFGTGATPPTLDRPRIKRIEKWLLAHTPPPYPYHIDPALSAEGSKIYQRVCAGCHGISGKNFSGALIGQVTPIDEIGTDRHRLDSYTTDLAVNQNLLYAGTKDSSERFSNFKKTYGYANMPLDGIWLRAPYLHNGSVPTLYDLLEPGDQRPPFFYRGYDVYDQARIGFLSDVLEENGRRHFKFDTRLPGNGNKGHEGDAYGTTLPLDQKKALVEYMKTF
ncbi:MAG: cytochrome c [Nitrospirota bacterium]